MRQVQTKQFVSYLRHLGLVHKRTKGSHDVWDYPDGSLDQPVILKNNLKDIPVLHIKTNLKTLGKTIEDLYRFLEA